MTCYTKVSSVISCLNFVCDCALFCFFTGEVMGGPRPEGAGLAGVFIKHKLVLFTGRAGPAAAHLTLTDHLHTHTHTQMYLGTEGSKL